MGVSESPKRRAGRPSAPVLSRELIVATALRLLTERGETGAGMRDIARELGVHPSALYNHVDGQEDLLGGVRELVSDAIDVSGFGDEPWDVALERWARSYRDAFAAHPPTIGLLAVLPLTHAARTVQMYERVCAGMMDAGWDADRTLSVIVAMENFILGSALDRSAPPDMLDPREEEAPSLRTAFDERSRRLAGTSPADDAFEIGLRAIITGLREEHERRRR